MANTKKISELVADNGTDVIRVGDQLMLTREGVSYGYENTGKFLIEYSAGVDGFRVSSDSSDVVLYSPDGNTVFAVQDASIDVVTDGVMSIQNTTGVIIGGGTPDSNALFQVDSTTQGILFPRMTTAQRNAIDTPPAGLVIYNTSTNKLNVFTTAWEAVTSV